MKLVVDTNIIFSALIKDSLTRKILTHLDAELYSIEFSEQEIKKYKAEIFQKAGMSEIELDFLLEKLKERLCNIDNTVVALEMQKALEIMKEIDPKDSPFLAAALATNSDIWSDDKHFEKQNLVKIWKTKDLVKLI